MYAYNVSTIRASEKSSIIAIKMGRVGEVKF